jgi:hypothetical protein
LTVLNFSSCDVGNKRHEIVSKHAFSFSALQNRVDGIVLPVESQRCLFSDIGLHSGNNRCAATPTPHSRGVDLLIKLPEICDRLNHSRGSPRSHSHLRISRLEPGTQRPWITPPNYHSLPLRHISIHLTQEVCHISQRLLTRQLLQTLQTPVVKRLRIAVKAVLQGEQSRPVRRPYHERVEAVFSYGAAVFAAEVEEVGAGGVGPVDVVGPVALGVGGVVLEVEVVD